MGTFSPGNSTCATAENKGVLPRKTLVLLLLLLSRFLGIQFSIQLETHSSTEVLLDNQDNNPPSQDLTFFFQMSFRIVSR